MKLNKEDGPGFGTVVKGNVNSKKDITKKRKYEDIPVTEPPQHNSKKHLYKPPTVEELNNLKETENLYNNNLFRLQIDELISEVTIKNKRKNAVSAWMQKFEDFLETIPEYEFLLSSIHDDNDGKSEINKFITKLKKYDPVFQADHDLLIKLRKPKSIQKFGLFENNCSPGPSVTLGVNVVMPAECFQHKDYLNYRYYTKRFYYLIYILELLKLKKMVTKFALKYYENNLLLPVIDIEIHNCTKCFVLIYVTPSEELFKAMRFLPTQNNIKINSSHMDIDNDILKISPTPFYNSSIAHDITLTANNNFIKEALNDLKSVQEGIKLICIWLKQRELNNGIISFSETLVVYFIVYLLHNKKINKYMSSYQVIRNFWNFIGSTDLHNSGISLTESIPEVINIFKKHFDIVFLDKSGCYNLTSFLTLEMYIKLKYECQAALKYLDTTQNNSFHQLFLTKFPFHLQYDIIIDLKKSLPFNTNFEITQKDKALYVGYENLLLIKYLLNVLQKALDNRILNIVPLMEHDGKLLKRLLLGVNLNPESAFNFLQKGPALNDFAAADEFRKFWGTLSSDRRFRDGSTNVAVHFKTNTMKGRRNIIKKIIDYVLEEKLNLKYELYYNQFEEFLISKKVVPLYPSGTNEETSLKIIQASDDLGKKLRALDMSLKITGVQGISEAFTFSQVFPPMPTNYKVGHNVTAVKGNHLLFQTNKKIGLIPRYVKPISSVLQLEHSSKWPNNLEALRHIKTAFYLEISKMLFDQHQIISHVTPDFIEVYFEGFVFRYLLNIPKEIRLLKKKATENGLIYFRESEESIDMEKKFSILPKVIGALKGIQSIYPSYGPGTALIKRWMRSQLIDDYLFPDIAINLINASLYLESSYFLPNTPQNSFLKFLKFFSEFDWQLQPVCVPFNEENFESQLPEIESNLQKNREAYANLYIITPYDQGLSVFTKNSPSQETLNRVRQLTKESLVYYEGLVNNSLNSINELFIPNLDGYNLLIHLRPLLNPRRHEKLIFENVQSRIIVEKYQKSADNKIPITDFDPVAKYLETLRKNYGKYAIFFHDSFGGNVIAVLWKPSVFQTSDFKVSQVNAMELIDNKLRFNIDAVIEDFFIIGKDLVKSIDKR